MNINYVKYITEIYPNDEHFTYLLVVCYICIVLSRVAQIHYNILTVLWFNLHIIIFILELTLIN